VHFLVSEVPLYPCSAKPEISDGTKGESSARGFPRVDSAELPTATCSAEKPCLLSDHITLPGADLTSPDQFTGFCHSFSVGHTPSLPLLLSGTPPPSSLSPLSLPPPPPSPHFSAPPTHPRSLSLSLTLLLLINQTPSQRRHYAPPHPPMPHDQHIA